MAIASDRRVPALSSIADVVDIGGHCVRNKVARQINCRIDGQPVLQMITGVWPLDDDHG